MKKKDCLNCMYFDKDDRECLMYTDAERDKLNSCTDFAIVKEESEDNL